jgi:hypothetical protein
LALPALRTTGSSRPRAAIAAAGKAAGLTLTLTPALALACAGTTPLATGTSELLATTGAGLSATGPAAETTAAFGATILATGLGKAAETFAARARATPALAGTLATTRAASEPDARPRRGAVGIGRGLGGTGRRGGRIAAAGRGKIGLGRHRRPRQAGAAQGRGGHGAGVHRRAGIMRARKAADGRHSLGKDRGCRQRGAQKQKAGQALHGQNSSNHGHRENAMQVPGIKWPPPISQGRCQGLSGVCPGPHEPHMKKPGHPTGQPG